GTRTWKRRSSTRSASLRTKWSKSGSHRYSSDPWVVRPLLPPFYASFRYQGQSWRRLPRVVAKVEWHPGELYPRVGFMPAATKSSRVWTSDRSGGRPRTAQAMSPSSDIRCDASERSQMPSGGSRWKDAVPIARLFEQSSRKSLRGDLGGGISACVV